MNQPPQHQPPRWQPPQKHITWGAQPPPGPPPPHYQPLPRPKPKFTDSRGFKFGCLPAIIIVWAVIITSVLTSGNDDKTNDQTAGRPSSASSAPETADRDKPSPSASKSAGLDERRITELSVGMVWDSYDEPERDLLCLGVEANGRGWFADQLESDNLDREYAGQLVEEKCASR